jgi:hypothetical protein
MLVKNKKISAGSKEARTVGGLGGSAPKMDPPDTGERSDQEAANQVARGGVEPPTFRFSGGRSYQLSYLAVRARPA